MFKEIDELSKEVELAKDSNGFARARGIMNDLTPAQKKIVCAALKVAIQCLKMFFWKKNKNSIISTLLGIIEQLIPD